MSESLSAAATTTTSRPTVWAPLRLGTWRSLYMEGVELAAEETDQGIGRHAEHVWPEAGGAERRARSGEHREIDGIGERADQREAREALRQRTAVREGPAAVERVAPQEADAVAQHIRRQIGPAQPAPRDPYQAEADGG